VRRHNLIAAKQRKVSDCLGLWFVYLLVSLFACWCLLFICLFVVLVNLLLLLDGMFSFVVFGVVVVIVVVLSLSLFISRGWHFELRLGEYTIHMLISGSFAQ
jgi:hypothetical protein